VGSYFILRRKHLRGELFKEPRVFSKFEAWLDLYDQANWKDTKLMIGMTIIEVKRGGLHTSERFLAKRWKWSINKVSRFLNGLTAGGNLDHKRSANGTTITITNYEEEQELTQDSGSQVNTPLNAKRIANGSQVNTRSDQSKQNKLNKQKEQKEQKEEFSLRFPPLLDNPEARALWESFVVFRRNELKKPYKTTSAQERALEKFLSLPHMAATIKASKASEWIGLFPENFDINGNRIGRNQVIAQNDASEAELEAMRAKFRKLGKLPPEEK
jgi:hypothetical protein